MSRFQALATPGPPGLTSRTNLSYVQSMALQFLCVYARTALFISGRGSRVAMLKCASDLRACFDDRIRRCSVILLSETRAPPPPAAHLCPQVSCFAAPRMMTGWPLLRYLSRAATATSPFRKPATRHAGGSHAEQLVLVHTAPATRHHPVIDEDDHALGHGSGRESRAARGAEGCGALVDKLFGAHVRIRVSAITGHRDARRRARVLCRTARRVFW